MNLLFNPNIFSYAILLVPVFVVYGLVQWARTGKFPRDIFGIALVFGFLFFAQLIVNSASNSFGLFFWAILAVGLIYLNRVMEAKKREKDAERKFKRYESPPYQD